jgi:hypothetical protein
MVVEWRPPPPPVLLAFSLQGCCCCKVAPSHRVSIMVGYDTGQEGPAAYKKGAMLQSAGSPKKSTTSPTQDEQSRDG